MAQFVVEWDAARSTKLLSNYDSSIIALVHHISIILPFILVRNLHPRINHPLSAHLWQLWRPMCLPRLTSSAVFDSPMSLSADHSPLISSLIFLSMRQTQSLPGLPLTRPLPLLVRLVSLSSLNKQSCCPVSDMRSSPAAYSSRT